MAIEKVIYDFGANEGSNLPYYLARADRVVAVEANPKLVSLLRDRFAGEISSGHLVVEPVAVSDGTSDDHEFYIHKKDSGWSQIDTPSEEKIRNFTKISVESVAGVDLVSKYGEPHYMKLDLEGYDSVLLRHLFSHDIRPRYLSAEFHKASVFTTIYEEGCYEWFKLVEGNRSRGSSYSTQNPGSNGRLERVAHPKEGAGPFGEEVPGPWVVGRNFFHALGLAGIGWRDIHATLDPTGPTSKGMLTMVRAGARTLGSYLRG
jgi:FkbM family methyltransferase